MHLPPREGAVHGYERVERGTDEVGVPQMRIGAGDFVADGERGGDEVYARDVGEHAVGAVGGDVGGTDGGVVVFGDEREVVD